MCFVCVRVNQCMAYIKNMKSRQRLCCMHPVPKRKRVRRKAEKVDVHRLSEDRTISQDLQRNNQSLRSISGWPTNSAKYLRSLSPQSPLIDSRLSSTRSRDLDATLLSAPIDDGKLRAGRRLSLRALSAMCFNKSCWISAGDTSVAGLLIRKSSRVSQSTRNTHQHALPAQQHEVLGNQRSLN